MHPFWGILLPKSNDIHRFIKAIGTNRLGVVSEGLQRCDAALAGLLPMDCYKDGGVRFGEEISRASEHINLCPFYVDFHQVRKRNLSVHVKRIEADCHYLELSKLI